MSLQTRISYAIMAVLLVLIGWLHLGVLVLTALFGYFAIQKFSLGRSRVLGLALYVIAVAGIAERYGTPCYIYSHATLTRHFRAYDGAFKDIPHVVAFAMKANSNLAILRLMAKEGSGVDIVSGGAIQDSTDHGPGPHCASVAKSVQFKLKAGVITLQLSDNRGAHVDVLVAHQP